ncbi:hypothetical protein IEQ34_005938 [Dendrobium chrysotoxum]|uniref:DUF4283 domain-containing protein n=1 Tax=Dendrobium chrysotoxum TaxID=161865 RepID=A0AAV7HCH9_DENCH|nr:hypothetical protein IEQ34_005938 [Dendrobium chrysotoxum]
MKLVKWFPYLNLTVESPIIPIWVSSPNLHQVSFPNLHPCLFSPRILNGLGVLFGRPLYIDNETVVASRPLVAWVLIELDITKHYLDYVWINLNSLGYVQSVVMENLPISTITVKLWAMIKRNVVF